MTQLASTSSASLAYKEELVYGEVATGAPALLRMLNESLSFDITTETSKEINSSRQVPDSIIVDASAGGGFNFNLSYKEYDTLLEALLASTFVDKGVSKTVTFTLPDTGHGGTITDDGVDGFAGLVAGQWFQMTSAASAGNNRYFLIKSKTDDVLTVHASTPVAVADSGDAVVIKSYRMSNGTAAMRSFSVEKRFADVAQFFMHKGQVPSKLDLNFQTGQILNGSFGFLGANAVRAGATGFSEAATASQAYGVMNAVTGVGTLVAYDSDGVSVLGSAPVKSMKISIDAKLRGQKAIGVLGNAGIGLGQYNMGGSLEMYLSDATLYDKAVAGALVSITFPVVDVAGNGYGFCFPNVKLSVPKANAGAQDADVMLNVDFTAVAPNTTTDRMIHIDRFGV